MMDPKTPRLLSRLNLKQPDGTWKEGQATTVTFVVTENCQLACRYCYVVGKNEFKKMNLKTAARAADYILSRRDFFTDDSVIFDFIGGEPFLEIELIDALSDHLKTAMYERGHPWFDSYRFSISTNGLLYADPRVQRYIEKNRRHLSIGITIDGTARKHDLQRVYKNGRGSYADVVKNIPLWLAQFPGAATKVTVSHDDLPYVKESVLHLWSLGITTVNINCVFENVWAEGDDLVLEEQLVALADHMVDHELYRDYHHSFFTESLGSRLPPGENQNWCGCGRKMIAVDCDGNFHPCNRFLSFTLGAKPGRCLGNADSGINENRLRPFQALDRITQSPPECLECDAASGCALCVGLNYDNADSETIYQRATFICRMHKARTRANRHYFSRLEEKALALERQG